MLLALATLLSLPPTCLSFTSPTAPRTRATAPGFFLKAVPSLDDVASRLERAKAILAKSKEKLAEKEQQELLNGSAATATATPNGAANGAANGATNGEEPSLPFFASRVVPPQRRRETVIKTMDEMTGLITTDGEKMATLSEQEEWELRGLLEVFENEIEGDDVYSMASKQLAERDVAASIWNLRKTLQTEDYQRIFDRKNFFIGEDN